MLDCFDADENNSSTKITVLVAILKSQSIIHNCFKHVGFIDTNDGLPIQISKLAPKIWEENVDNDSALLTSAEPSDENNVQNIKAREQLEGDGEEEVEEEPLPTAEEALKAIE
ncbi:hypothetical protein HHI36_014384 [Cryptolaemus montrouzieri]|uniref:Condensin complex subunit 2 n=1 Tax=Cryptolaemus montrouzieri TaxID=559131 RepID=A0ABD2N2E0_9CUCU